MVAVSLSALLLTQSAQAVEHVPLEVMGRVGYVYSPPGKQATSAVFVLHGSGCSPSDYFGKGFEALADERGFHVVYPEMKVPKGDAWGGKDDISYFEALIQRLQQVDFGVTRHFVSGHSAGGSMSYFLQNEMPHFEAAGIVEAGADPNSEWDLTKVGLRTIIVWNHADPVLTQYAPGRKEMAYYNQTLKALHRQPGSDPDSRVALPTSHAVVQAERLTFNKNAVAPELKIVSWTSKPGKHDWALPSWTITLDATKELVDFFLGESEVVV